MIIESSIEFGNELDGLLVRLSRSTSLEEGKSIIKEYKGADNRFNCTHVLVSLSNVISRDRFLWSVTLDRVFQGYIIFNNKTGKWSYDGYSINNESRN